MMVVKLKEGTEVKGYGARISKSGKSLIVIVRQCTCYRNTCDCVKEYQVRVEEVESIDGKLIEEVYGKEIIEGRSRKKNKIVYNTEMQYYRGLPLRLVSYKSGTYKDMRAKRYAINDTIQKIWIPNVYLLEDGTIKEGVDIMFVFRRAVRQLELAGYKLK